MKNGLKLFFFRHHWWIGPGVGAVVATLVVRTSLPDKGTALAAVVASVLSVSFFAQQQKLAEMNLFKQLITEFTQRYDRINGTLEAIGRAGRAHSPDEQQAVVDYFNLCAEEYLFFSEGYIHRRVWRSWCRGMLYYFEKAPFRDLWATESLTESYYGMTIEEIRKGAA